jgi:mRNA interferase MazF
MSYRTYIPDRGDLIHMNFSPSAGHELADRHYALVISASAYNRKSRMAVVCGITSTVRDWPFEVELPVGLLPPKRGQVEGVILADSVRQIDVREREVEYVARVPQELVERVLDMVLTIFED